MTEPTMLDSGLVSVTDQPRHGGGYVTTVTLTRGRKRNALSGAMCRDIGGFFARLRADGDQWGCEGPAPDSPRLVVIEATGPAFCAGADLDTVHDAAFLSDLYTMLRAIVLCPVPVIAVIDGPAVGAGLQLALACDRRLAGPRASFRLPPAALGFPLDAWTVNRLVDMVGLGRAQSMLLDPQPVPATTAAAMGLCEGPGTTAGVDAVIERMAHLAPLSLAQLKTQLRGTLLPEDPATGGDSAGSALAARCFASSDVDEAMRARQEKRRPRFTGR
ncbi:enoyl-CoA hydratase-related protein [Corynebacterium mendelii]|uniref:Enoyl-CoA hydratase/isomerase family protein n=1 Tax=Corynebacterium mendelii TaxID=2765362 RepID=A0A939E1E4_9CORY|nr:enoyl-CoA hydratase-related protein [Corynebacterium mendelii]MBN9644670.1 enoyl-CoA hydratase/isomerase family protein [Corynebacterium mendelii]